MEDKDEYHRIGYFSVIPATILFNKELKPNEKLLYAVITSLSNKEGYCYASNRYLANYFGVDPVTVSRWLANLREHHFIFVDIARNENKEIISRKIYPNDVPYRLNNQYPYRLNNQYPYRLKYQECIDENVKENNIINNNIITHTVTKKYYADKVLLYESEYDRLVSEYGQDKASKCIEQLDLYKNLRELNTKVIMQQLKDGLL